MAAYEMDDQPCEAQPMPAQPERTGGQTSVRIELDGEVIGRLVYETVMNELGRNLMERKYTG